MADLSDEPQPLSFAIEGADKQHVAASVTAENADCDAKGSIATGADGATIDKDDIIRELMTQLQANTDRLATLEANIKTINGAVGLPENPVVHPEPVDAEGDHLHASRGPDEVETADSDTDDEDVEDDGDSEEDNAKRTAKIIARRMKYLPSEEWIPNKISETYKIDDFLPSSLSVVVSLEAKVSMTHHVIHSTLPEADCGSKPETGRSRPDRLAIPCATLLSEIAKISGTIISTRTNVFVRPFKNVIPFREEYHESLIQSKEAYSKLKKLKKEKEASYAEACKVADELGEATPSKEEFHLSMADQSSLATARKLYLGLTCLLHFIDNDNAEIMYLRRQVKTRDFEISFENLWHIFEPGQLVCPKGDKDQAYRVLNVGGGRPHRDMPDHDGSLQTKSKTQKVTDFFVDCFNTDFNGTHYVPTPLTMYIPPYDGTRPIKSLAVRPLEYLYSGEEEKDVRKKLVDRGKKFVRLAAVSHQRYSGLSLQDRDLRCEEVDGDVIIDFALAFKNNRVSLEERLMDPYISFQPPRSDISITDYYTPQSIEETREQCSASCSIPGCTMCPATVSYFYDDASFEFVRRTRFLEVSAALLKDIEQDLGDDRHLLLPYRMYGYVLLSRKWYPLDIDLLQDIDESHNESDGFKDLVLPEDHKQIVRALVKTHARGPRSASGEKDIPARQMDLVKGKGKGLIILLHGVPGVGKTSTAECVAAHTNRPLFPITCGDIGGQTPREVETNLESYFDLARKWGCVLLLDEADVFLGERTKGDILQNSLVSVFLRVLEYYSGVLILTTNRVGQFDEAIKSRIHISLYYPPLNKERTMRIWKMNLERLEREYGANRVLQNAGKPVRKATLPHVEFERHEIMDFAEGHWETCTPNKSHWNGRQIKNAFQTAIALAEWDAMDIQRKHKLKETIPIVLQKHHFKKVADASARFDEYLVAVRKTDSYNAKVKSNRLDEFNDKGTSSMYGMTYASYEERQQQRRNVRRTPVDADMREFDDQDDDLRVKKASGPMETRRYLPEDRTRKEPIQLSTVSDRGDRRNEQYVLADRFNGGRGPAYDDDGV